MANIEKVLIKLINDGNEERILVDKRRDVNLTSTIVGSNSRNRCGRWLELHENTTVSISVTRKTPGGMLLDRATVWQEFADGRSHRVTLLADGCTSRFTIYKQIPPDGELVVRKPPQEWRFRLVSDDEDTKLSAQPE